MRGMRLLVRRLGVPKNQEWAALASMLFFAVFLAGVVGVKAAANALFLSNHSAQTLPALYVLSAGSVAFGSYMLARPLAHYSAYAVGKYALRISAFCLIAVGAMAWVDLPGVQPVLYILGETYTTLLSILFWGTLSEVFDLRTSKRVLGIIGAAGMAGSVVGGAAVEQLSMAIHPASQVVAAGFFRSHRCAPKNRWKSAHKRRVTLHPSGALPKTSRGFGGQFIAALSNG
jgi:hypothetical protein